MENYKEFTITSTPFLPEILQGILWELNISGIQEEDNFIKLFCEDINSVSKEMIEEKLQSLVFEKIIESFQLNEKILQNQNWNEEWEKSRDVIIVSEKLLIKPSFKNYSAKPDQIAIIIDPKMSFGTGEHESTKLCLLFLEKYVTKNFKVLDVGSGTAILAIAAVKFGAEWVIAIDNDEWSYENSKENCEMNGVQHKIDIRLTEMNNISENNFDIIAANIQRDVLIELKSEIKKRIRKNGFVILSGILRQQKEEIEKEYEDLGFELIDSNESGEWISMVFLLE